MSKPLFDPAPIIANYEAAYRAANNSEPLPIYYEHGWFVFLSLFEARKSYRRQNMIVMTEELARRSKNKDDADYLYGFIRCTQSRY